MAKALVFKFGKSELSFGYSKVDRKKLYGFVDEEVVDGTGQGCQLATLGGDGRTLVGRGGSALLMLDADGKYCERTALKPVNENGEPLTKAASSFDAPISLERRASIADYLDHNVKAVYALVPPMGADELVAELKKGVIYTFAFSFRGGLSPDVGFLLVNPEGLPFLALGRPTRLHFVTLEQPGELDDEELSDGEDEDEDAMDFGMM